MALMTKDEILAVNDREHEDVEVPGWGTVRLRVMSGIERAEIEKRFSDQGTAMRDPAGFRGQLLVRTIVDDDDKPVFVETDIKPLMAKSAAPLECLFEHACRMNGFTGKDVEVLEKNSPSGRNGDSPSG